MATSTSFPQKLQFSTGASMVKLAPVQDSETGDEILEPEFVRVRAPNRAYLYLETSPDTQVDTSTNTASWIVGQASPGKSSQLFARKIKRMSLVYVQILWATPNVNPTNNTIRFRVQENPALTITCTIPTYNYMRLFTQTGPAGANIDIEDGILTKMVASMTTALNLAGFPGVFTVVPSDGYRDVTPSVGYNDTNVLFWRIARSPGGTFIFEGGSLFERGLFLLGLKEIDPNTNFANPANYYTVYQGGPVSFLYTRWIDITTRALVQNAKIEVAGTNYPINLLQRFYLTKDDQKSGFISLTLAEPNQWFNWRKDQTINTVDIQLRDEFGGLVEIPQRGNNASWMGMAIAQEL